MVSRLLIISTIAALAIGPALGDPLDAAIGKALFNRAWVAAPSSTTADDGLGPVFNARACSACHQSSDMGSATVVRVGTTCGNADALYGAQIQTAALPGFQPEARVRIAWNVHDGLRSPNIHFDALAFGALDKDTHIGLRRAPSLAGIGALTSVPDADIIARAASGEESSNSISGRIAWLTSANGTRTIGRLGWKSTAPDIDTQVARALSRDMGLSTSLFPAPGGDCIGAAHRCTTASAAGDVEVSDVQRAMLVSYLQSLQTPTGPLPTGPGYAAFVRSGCATCHAAIHGKDGADLHAYTDLLLHNMGKGLDDGIGEPGVQSAEWRTAPLWNLRESLQQKTLLHDGRARSIEEAVLWHGGEAEPSRRRFESLPASERAQLINFLLQQ